MERTDHSTTAELVRPLLVFGLTSWIGVAVLETAATATFVAELGASRIPVVNLVGAALAATLGLGYAAIHRSGRDGSKSLAITVVLVAVLAAGLALGLGIQTSAGLVFAGLVLYRLTKIVMPTALWDAAGERLDIAQGKRLFGLVGVTQPIGRVAAYASVPFLVTIIGTTGLFVVAALSLAVAAVSLHWARRPANPQERPAGVSRRPSPTDVAPSVGEVLRGRMVPPILLLAAATTAGYTILSFSFSLAGGQRYPSADSLATAVAVVSALSASMAAFAGLVGSRGLLRRFGVPGAVAAKGLAVAIGGLTMAMVAGATTGTGAVFLAVAGLRIVDDITTSLSEPAVRLLGRVLPPARRAVVNAATDGVVAPAALALSSVVILLLEAGGADTFPVLGVLIAGVAGAGAATAWVFARDYREVLREALAERRIDLHTDELDADTLVELDRVLTTGTAPAVAYALDLLDAADPDGRSARLAALLGHPNARVRLDVLARIEALDLVDVVPAIRSRLPAEGSPEVRAASVRVMAVLTSEDALDDLLPYLRARDPAVRRGAMSGLLRSGDIEAILAAGEPLLALVRSDDPHARREAAIILGEGGLSGLHRPLRALLTDAEPTVVEAALQAAPVVGHPKVWPLVIDQLSNAVVRSAAQRAVERGGDGALASVTSALPLALADDRSDAAIALLSSLGRMGPGAVRVVLDQVPRSMSHPDRAVGDAAASALLRLHVRCTGREAEAVQADLDRGLDAYAVMLADEDAVHAGCPSVPLVAALLHLLQVRRYRLATGLLSRWALLQEREVAEPVVAVLGDRPGLPPSSEDRSYATEALESGPQRTAGELIVAALSDTEPVALRAAFASRGTIDLTERSVYERLLAGAGRQDPVRAALALQIASEVDEPRLVELLDRASVLGHPFVSSTADQIRDRLDHAEQEAFMMTPVERMVALKSSELLAEADDDLLAEILDQVTLREVDEHDVLFTEGAAPDRLYLLLSGQVALTSAAGGRRVVGPGDLAGEVAILAGAPYTATATATQAGVIFELPAPVVELLLAAEPTFSRELLRRTARRARQAETGHGGTDDTMASILDRLVDSEAT